MSPTRHSARDSSSDPSARECSAPRRVPLGSLLRASPWAWLGILSAAKAADSLTTLLALRLAGVHEANPVVASIHAAFGRVPGELFVATVGVLALAGAIELIARTLARGVHTPTLPFRDRARRIGYATAALLFVAVALSNSVQYVTHL